MSAQPLRIMFDTMCYDDVATDESLRVAIEHHQTAGRIVVRATHIQRDQLVAMPANRDVGQAAAINAELIETSVAIIGATALNEIDVLVTRDKRLRSRLEGLGATLRVMSPTELADYLGQVS